MAVSLSACNSTIEQEDRVPMPSGDTIYIPSSFHSLEEADSVVVYLKSVSDKMCTPTTCISMQSFVLQAKLLRDSLLQEEWHRCYEQLKTILLRQAYYEDDDPYRLLVPMDNLERIIDSHSAALQQQIEEMKEKYGKGLWDRK